jgi:hypothetical protein
MYIREILYVEQLWKLWNTIMQEMTFRSVVDKIYHKPEMVFLNGASDKSMYENKNYKYMSYTKM